jgi:hypothetical protein
VRYCCAINGTQSPADIESVVVIVPLLMTEIWRVAIVPAVKSPQSIFVRSWFEPTAVTFTPIAIIRPEKPLLP